MEPSLLGSWATELGRSFGAEAKWLGTGGGNLEGYARGKNWRGSCAGDSHYWVQAATSSSCVELSLLVDKCWEHKLPSFNVLVLLPSLMLKILLLAWGLALLTLDSCVRQRCLHQSLVFGTATVQAPDQGGVLALPSG